MKKLLIFRNIRYVYIYNIYIYIYTPLSQNQSAHEKGSDGPSRHQKASTAVTGVEPPNPPHVRGKKNRMDSMTRGLYIYRILGPPNKKNTQSEQASGTHNNEKTHTHTPHSAGRSEKIPHTSSSNLIVAPSFFYPSRAAVPFGDKKV